VGHVRPPDAGDEPCADLSVTHYVNLLFLVLLIRSGLQILMDHPRLYGIQEIECVEGVRSLDRGEGGYNEDHEYFGELASI
jgi:hypothetical protein